MGARAHGPEDDAIARDSVSLRQNINECPMSSGLLSADTFINKRGVELTRFLDGRTPMWVLPTATPHYNNTLGSFLDYTARSCISNWNEVRNRYLKHAHLSEREFRQVLKMYCADVGALTASKLTGLNKNTTHRLYGLLRVRVVEMAKGEAAHELLEG
jgi:hypothetical protein